MSEVRVWAPLASSVEVVTDDRRFTLTRDGDDFVGSLPDGTLYLLSVDGGEPRPDPRSARQPQGVHGLSEMVDPARFTWSDASWPGIDALGKVFYELHVGTFTPEGTLDAAAARLPDLAEVGVQIVELMPLASFPGERGWGYDGVDWYSVQESYGGPDALARFVDAAHHLGLGVCLDVVYNHFGPAGNYTSTFGPYLTDKHSSPWGAGINLDDAHCEGVRAFIVDNALRWIRDFHIDALRLDAVHALADDSPRHILAELSDAVAALARDLGRPASLVAECDLNQATIVTPTALGGDGMTAQWDDDVHHALHAYLTGEHFGYYDDFGSPETLAKALTRVFVHDGVMSTFRGRVWGAPVSDDVDRRRFVVCSQDHDQVGNRGRGDRPASLHGTFVEAAALAVIALGPYTPMLFEGQEWGATTPFQYFTDHDPELGRLVTAGRLAEFAHHGWTELYGDDAVIPDPQALSTFEASRLDWSERETATGQAMLAWTRTLFDLRREFVPDAAATASDTACAWGDDWFVMTHGRLGVGINRADDTVTIPGSGNIRASWGEAQLTASGIELGRRGVVVWLLSD